MVSMLQVSLRAPVTRLITPLCRGLLKVGLSANSVTVLGTAGTVAASFTLLASGHLFAATIVITLLVLTDLLDGTMARLSESGGSDWGALLDSTMDRISDASILGALIYYLIQKNDRLTTVAIMALVASGLVSYIKARAESLDIECNGGFAERTERLVLLLVSTAGAGLGIHYILAIGIWILALAAIFTTGERLLIVYKATR